MKPTTLSVPGSISLSSDPASKVTNLVVDTWALLLVQDWDTDRSTGIASVHAYL